MRHEQIEASMPLLRRAWFSWPSFGDTVQFLVMSLGPSTLPLTVIRGEQQGAVSPLLEGAVKLRSLASQPHM